MRIGIDLSPLRHSSQRGIGAYARGLITGLGKVAPEHEYVLFTSGDLGAVKRPPKCRVVCLPGVRLGRASALVTSQLALPWLARKAGLDVLHVLDVPYNPSHPAPPLVKPCPLVVTLLDLTPLYSPPVLRTWRYRTFYRVALWLAGRADALVAISAWSRREAVRAHVAPARSIFVAHLAPPEGPADDRGSSTALATSVQLPDGPYVLHVGSADWNKNREGVLRAFAQLAPVPDLRLVLVGGGDVGQRDLPEQLRNRVLQFSGLSRDGLHLLYRNAAVFLFPSRYEGFGLPILEAMAVGTPVVTSNRGAMREVADNAALLVDPEDPAALAGAVRRLLDDPLQAQRLGALGRQRAAQFSWERTARATLEAYRYATVEWKLTNR